MKDLMKVVGLLLLLSLFLYACDKENAIEQVDNNLKIQKEDGLSDVKLENGMLIFQNQEHFDKVKLEIEAMSESQLIDWEKSLDFTSMYRLYSNIKKSEANLVDYYETLSETEIEEFQLKGEFDKRSEMTEKYLKSGFLKVYNEGTESEFIDIACFAKILDKVLNEKGLVKVGNEIHQYSEEYFKVIKNGNFDEIKKIDKIKISSENIFVTKPFVNNTIKLDPDKSWSDENHTNKDKMIEAGVRFMQFYTNSDSTIFRTYFWVDIQLFEHRWFKWRLTDGTAYLRGYYKYNEGNGEITSYEDHNLYGNSTYRYTYIDKTTSVSSFSQALEVTYVNLRYERIGGDSGIKLYLNYLDSFAPTGRLF